MYYFQIFTALNYMYEYVRGPLRPVDVQVSGDWWRGSVAGREGLIPDKYILLKIRYYF
jgi:hypothetical protein